MDSQLSGVQSSEHLVSSDRSGRRAMMADLAWPTIATYAGAGPCHAAATRTAAWTSAVTLRIQNLFV